MKIPNIPQIWLAQDFVTDENFSEQCNCACTYSTRVVDVNSQAGTTTELRTARVHVAQLTNGYYILFGLEQAARVAVLNQMAYKMWEDIDGLQNILNGDDNLNFRQELLRAGLLVPADSQLQINPPDTLTAWLHITNYCNLSCDYCFVDKTRANMILSNGQAAIQALIRSARAQHMRKLVLKFAGGEPTLCMSLVLDLLEYARQQTDPENLSIKAVLLSNGTALTPQVIEAIRSNGIQVSISLDGVGASHDCQRHFPDGRGSFMLVERGIERLCQAGITPFISITLTPGNIEQLPQLIQFVLQRDLPFNLNFFRDHECSGLHTPLAFDELRTIALLRQVMKQIEADLPENFSLLGELLDRTQLNTPRLKACGAGESYMVIDHLGNISRCHMDMAHPVTDIHAKDVLAKVQNTKYGLQNINVDEKHDCKSCAWRYACAGGCPLETYHTTGRFDSRSPNCNIYREIFPELIRLEGLRLMNKVGLT